MAERRPPTPEQRAAIEAEGAAVVRAGAGSGKTRVLAERFLHLLRPASDAPEVSQILAITFTEKAAAEMKGRIRQEVAHLIETTDGDVRRHWQRVRRDLLGANVSTIHAFSARVLRENPLEAGIDPRAAVLDEHESRTFVEAAVETELLARLRAGDPAARALVLGQPLRAGRDGGVVGLVVRFLGWLGTVGRDGAWLRAATATQEAGVGEARNAMRAAAARIVAAIGARVAKGGKSDGLRALAEAWPHWERVLADLTPEMPLPEVLELRALCTLLSGARLGREVGADLALNDGKLTGKLAESYGTVSALGRAQGLARLVAELADAVAGRKRAEAVLTFDDLIGEARNLFRDHAGVRERYARRFRAVLVDEFQDTDAVQADLVWRLAADPGGPALFIVGDEKQAIYRFRGADVRVFQRLREQIGREYPLGTNFRSEPAVLDFVNGLAARVLRVPAGAGDAGHWTVFDPGQRLVPDRPQNEPRPAVRLVSLAAEHRERSLRADEARELEARVLAGVIADLHDGRGVPYGHVAVLFRALTAVKAYEHALRERGIPYYVVKGRGFFQCQEVVDVTSLLTAIADPDDGRALAAVLRSPFFGVDDETLRRLAWPPGATRARLARRFRARETFADLPERAAALAGIRDLLLRLRALRSRATIAELISEALAATDFEAVCLTQFQGTQKVANVRRLIELARDHEGRRFFTLRDFVRELAELVVREPREAEAQLVGEQDDVVRLMTIHQAKGLEFPVVVLPDLGRRIDPDTRVTVLDEERGLLCEPIDDVGRRVVGNAWLKEYRAREGDRNRAELARLFYVACTRARDRLVLIEGKGDPKYLTTGKGDAFIWCHQVWDLLGRERVAAFVESGEPGATLEVDEGEVLVERAERYRRGTFGRATEPPAPVEAPPGDVERTAVSRVLDFRPPAPAEIVAVPTALADFRRCPRQYWYRHVLALPERGPGGARATLLGTAAHAVLEAIDLETTDAAEIARRVEERPETLLLRDAERAALVADLEAAAGALRAEIADGLAVVGREVPFVLRLGQVFLHGRIDLLARRGDVLVVRDYKYARPSPEAVERHAAQLTPYRLAVRAAGAASVEAELVFLRGGPTVHRLPAIDDAAEGDALVAAATALAAADATEALPRGPASPSACEALGCGYVGRCWATGRAPDPGSGRDAA